MFLDDILAVSGDILFLLVHAWLDKVNSRIDKGQKCNYMFSWFQRNRNVLFKS